MNTNLLAATVIGASLISPPLHAQEAPTGVNQRIQKLEEELALLKRQLEVKEEKEKSTADKVATAEMGKKGFKVTSPDKNYELSIRGYGQFDARFFPQDNASTGRNDLLARRLRPILEVKAHDASFRLMPDFAGSTTRVFDAHVDYKLNDSLQFRFGKFKPPVSLERLQSVTDLLFAERGHPTNLAPNREFGFMTYGNPIPDILEYQVGIFNGTADLGNTDGDDDDKKDLVARVFSQPFRNSSIVSLQGLGVGIAGTVGEREGNASRRILGTYKTPGQQDFFAYRSDTYADGTKWRLYPQAYWYSGNKGVLAEYAISHEEVARAGQRAKLDHHAWQVAASYVLTGEDVNYRGGIKPQNDFKLGGGIGAWEVVARTGGTDIDNGTFGFFADPNVAASSATTYSAGINWYLNENFKQMLDYEYTKFAGGAVGGDRPDEHFIVTRSQFRF